MLTRHQHHTIINQKGAIRIRERTAHDRKYISNASVKITKTSQVGQTTNRSEATGQETQ